MNIQEINNFITSDYLKLNTYLQNEDKQTQAFVVTIKIAEETGELAREVSRAFGFAKQKRLNMPSNLDSELADVIINTLLLAKSLDIDAETAIQNKMNRIKDNLLNKDSCCNCEK